MERGADYGDASWFANVVGHIQWRQFMSHSGFIAKHPVLTYYVVTFAISWGSIFLVVERGGTPANPAQLGKMIPIMIVAMLAGPTVASILLTGIVSGRAGYRDLLARLVSRRIAIEWYSAALLTAPLVLMAVPLALSLWSTELMPKIITESNKATLLLMGFAAGAAAGCFEELGWTGFVVPRLRSRFGAIRTGVIVGTLWGAWHLPVNVLSSFTASGRISISALLGTLLFSFALLPAFRILMVLVWDDTGSLLVAMFMHLSLTASNIVFGATATPGMMAVTFNFVLAAAMWLVVAASIVAGPEGGLMRSRVQ